MTGELVTAVLSGWPLEARLLIGAVRTNERKVGRKLCQRDAPEHVVGRARAKQGRAGRRVLSTDVQLATQWCRQRQDMTKAADRPLEDVTARFDLEEPERRQLLEAARCADLPGRG